MHSHLSKKTSITYFIVGLCGAFVLGTASLAPKAVAAAEMATTEEGSIARGGKLYDKWYKVIKEKAPKKSHGLYPKDKKYAKKPKANWRCKECHGWDYSGKDGAYKKGKHHSGIKGVRGMAGASPDKIVGVLKSKEHGYGGKMSKQDLMDLANFVSKGLVDMDPYIDRKSMKPKGNAKKGAVYFETVCAGCHGMTGLLPKEMKPFGAQMGNPWEVMHKILNGQPGEQMPALRALDRQVIADVLAYMTTLPKKR